MLDQEYETYIHDALMHYADSVHLLASPLLRELASATASEEDRVTTLRGALRRAVEALRPAATVPYGEAEWLPYRVLWGRCIQRRSPSQLCDELSLSRATLFRYQAQAVKSVAQILAQQLLADDDLEHRARALQHDSSALAEASRLAQAADREVVDLHTLLNDIERIVHALLEEHGTSLAIRMPDAPMQLYGDPAMLRQIVIQALTGALRMGSHQALTLSVESARDEAILRLCGLRGAPGCLSDEHAPELAMCRELLQVYGGQLAVEQDGEMLAIRLAWPSSQPPTVIVVDDDRDTIELYRRYLGRAGYTLRLISSGAELWETLDELQPDLIILDVLMPKEDGWLILQRLQTLPETATIPVIVYSVLAQPSLALSLGAQKVLLKPVQEDTLHEAIRQVLSQADNAG